MNGPLTATSAPPGDSVLIEQIRRGEEAAFYAFYKRHARYIAGVAYRLLASNDEVDDIVQETFITAFEKMNDLRSPEYVRLWLAKIAVRRAHRQLARRRRDLDLEKSPGETCHRTTSRLDDLREALGRLPRKYGEPWIMQRLEGWTVPEVADALRISPSTVKRRLSAAEKRLRSKIDVYA